MRKSLFTWDCGLNFWVLTLKVKNANLLFTEFSLSEFSSVFMSNFWNSRRVPFFPEAGRNRGKGLTKIIGFPCHLPEDVNSFRDSQCCLQTIILYNCLLRNNFRTIFPPSPVTLNLTISVTNWLPPNLLIITC